MTTGTAQGLEASTSARKVSEKDSRWSPKSSALDHGPVGYHGITATSSWGMSQDVSRIETKSLSNVDLMIIGVKIGPSFT